MFIKRVFHGGICVICACILIWISGCFESGELIDNPINPESPSVNPQSPDLGGEVGNQAPDFSLPDELGNIVTLSDYTGKNKIVLIFHIGST